MWKMSFFTMILATVFLGGCNWGNNAADETPMEDTRNDIREGVNDVEDAIDPDRNDDVYDRDVNGDRGTVNDNNVIPDATAPGTNADMNGTNGVDNAPNANGVDRNNNNMNGTNGVNNEDIIEDNKDIKDRDNLDNR
ncbi:hypothetical protein ACMGD3_17080 [Lysinibacillus sphaericus]|uniref:Lipoprotein n=2 Tax=Lysinibacillus TaxID=400634 RepID=R7ZIV4_LYSSH|nr:hypothetical protein [Lysinibacillus sphaericus]EON74042.1 hypothetical protein H131_05244 [Lysinibacillus sphaericus OT4b.31]